MKSIITYTEADLVDLCDFSAWPIMIARLPGYENFKDSGMQRWIAGFELAIARDEPFVVILEIDDFLKDPREDPAQKKQGAMAMKRIRERYNALCRGNIYVVSDPEQRKQVVGEAAGNSRKFSFPFLTVADLAEARQTALRLLSAA